MAKRSNRGSGGWCFVAKQGGGECSVVHCIFPTSLQLAVEKIAEMAQNLKSGEVAALSEVKEKLLVIHHPSPDLEMASTCGVWGRRATFASTLMRGEKTKAVGVKHGNIDRRGGGGGKGGGLGRLVRRKPCIWQLE